VDPSWKRFAEWLTIPIHNQHSMPISKLESISSPRLRSNIPWLRAVSGFPFPFEGIEVVEVEKAIRFVQVVVNKK